MPMERLEGDLSHYIGPTCICYWGIGQVCTDLYSTQASVFYFFSITFQRHREFRAYHWTDFYVSQDVLMWNNMEGEKEGKRRRWGTSQDTKKKTDGKGVSQV